LFEIVCISRNKWKVWQRRAFYLPLCLEDAVVPTFFIQVYRPGSQRDGTTDRIKMSWGAKNRLNRSSFIGVTLKGPKMYHIFNK